MYIAPPSREERHDVLISAIRDMQFGALVRPDGEGLEACHLPMLVQQEADGTWVLEGHVARVNPIWKDAPGRALAIFQGPQAYIHPGWYPTKQRDGRAVPTWNYIAVHAHGALSAVDDRGWLARHVEALTRRNEEDRLEPWSIADAPAAYIDAMINGIVGVRLAIERIEGNWKMAQKQPLENRLGAADGLAGSARHEDRAVGAIIAAAAGRL